MAQDRVIGFTIRVNGSEKVVTTIAELEQSIKDTNKELKNTEVGSEAYERLNEELADAKRQLNDVKAEQRAAVKEAERAANAGTGSYKELNAELIGLKKQFRELSAVERDGEAGAALISRIQDLDGQLKDLDKTIGQSFRNVGNYESAFDGLKGQVSGFIANLPALAITAITTAVVAGVQAVADLTKEFEALRGSIEQLTGATGADLDNYTARVKALADTFGVSTEEIIQSTNALSKQLTGDFSTALDAVEAGFVGGVNASGEFLASLSEYSTQAAAAGLSTEEFVNILNQSTKEGVFSDKGIDAVKEFGLRIREQADGTKEALSGAFGEEFTSELFGNINSGAITTAEALQQVAGRLDETTVPANKLQTVIADVFGGAGEDAGLQFLQSLENIGGTLEDVAESGGEFGRSQRTILELNQELAAAQNALTREFQGGNTEFTKISTTIKTTLIEGFTQAIRNIKFLVTGITDIGRAVVDFVRNSETLTRVASFFEPLINIIKLPIAIFTVDYPAAFAGFRAAAAAAFDSVKNVFTGLVDSAKLASLQVQRALSIREDTKKELDDQIKEIKARQKSVAQSGQSIGEAFTEAYNEALAKGQDEREARRQEEAKAIQAQAKATGQIVSEEVSGEGKAAAGSIGALEDAISKLNAELQNTAPNAEKYRTIQAQINQLQDELNDALILRQRIQDDLLAQDRGEIAQLETRAAAEIQLEDKKADILKAIQKDIDKTNADLSKQQVERAKAQADELIAIEQQKRDAINELAALGLDTAFELAAIGAEKEKEQQLATAEARFNRELQLAEGNEAKQTQLKAQFEAQRDQIDKQFREREKKRAISQAILNGALAITRILAEVPKGDFGIATGILIGLATAQTAAQVAVISAQQFAKGGILSGARHSQGGVPVATPSGIVEAEGGEAIINRRSTAMFKPLLSQINEAGGGVRFANGGITPTNTALQNFELSQGGVTQALAGLKADIDATKAMALAIQRQVVNLNVNLDTPKLNKVQNTQVRLNQLRTS